MVVPPFFPKASREQARHTGLLLLQAQNDEKNQKKADAAEKILASEAPKNTLTGLGIAHTRGRGGKTRGRRGRPPANSHALGAPDEPDPQPDLAPGIAMPGVLNGEQPDQQEPVVLEGQQVALEGQPLAPEAIRRRREMEEQQEQAQQPIETNDEEDSLPPANRLFADLTEGDGRERSRELETSSRRRRRSASMDLNTPEERQRKYGCFTESECDRFSLRGSRRSLVMDFAKSDSHEKMITIMAFLQRRETEQANVQVHAYLASGAFKAHALLLFYTALVAPHNKGYVNSLGTFIEHDMVCNYALYKIDKSIVEDSDSRVLLNSQMRINLATSRHKIKDKLDAAVEKGYCINQILVDIIPKKIEVTVEHRRRWAWVVAQYRKYKADSRNTSNFWRELDRTLNKTEDNLIEHVPDKRVRDETRAQIYINALEDHEKEYPNQVPAPEKVDTPSWQIMVERNLDKYHTF
ncbi:unnamed protein product [Rhizoctonia solani]|uniref:Uncharacterized protein n=1 Tax=Rhizoctonia solani TaxID=456999 RepID=A0A8H2WJC4_9AGAM|nr:unnamed protein product [Rhizoctonia solani]